MKAYFTLPIVAIALAPSGLHADAVPTPVGNGPIVFGMSTALTGPAAQLGQSMQAGVNAAFEEANRLGGIHGRQLTLIAMDDGYEPTRTAPNMRSLVRRDDVIAVVGNVGTPTAVAAVPIANGSKTLLFGAFTGAGVLRKTPPDRYVINYRASYAEETAAMVDALVNEAGIGVEQIAFFTQRDAYGDAGFVGGIAAMKKNGLKDDLWVAHGRYERNTDAVENGLADIIGARTPVEAVIMVGAYAPCAQFIKLAHEFDFHPIFLNVSFVGSEPLARALRDEGDGVIVTQVVPHFDADIPIAGEFRVALSTLDKGSTPSFGSFEGYIVGRILVRALLNGQGPPSRESVVDALEHLGKFDIGLGQELDLGPRNHQACHRVWPTVIQNGKLVAIEWTQLKARSKGTQTSNGR